MTKSLKIVHLLASSKWTGPAEGVVTLCRDLKHQGHDVRFYCNLLKRRLLADRAVERGVNPLEGLRLNTKNPVTIGWDVHQLKNILKEERPDILHLHLSTDHWIGALSARWASLSTRVIRTVHHPNSLRPIPFRRWLYESMTHGFITLSEKDRQHLTRFYRIEPKPVAVIHGAVDTARFHPDHDPRPIRAEFGIGPATPVVGMVARFQPHRRHEVMIQAMVTLRRLIPTARLILVGRGEYRPVLERFVRKRGLQHHVFFAGYRDQDLPQVYAAMDVKVYLASGSDASCRAVLEAMACGLPVIAYPVGAVPETLVDGLTGYPVAKNDTEALARRLAELLGDRNTARKMGEAARLRVEEYFSEKRRICETEAFYYSLTGSSLR